MFKIAHLGRVAVTAVMLSGLSFVSLASAADLTEDQIKTARATVTALQMTTRFDNFLPTMAEQIKAQMIASNPNFEADISKIVDGNAIKLAARRADLEKEAATIYAKAFTVDELKAITDFFTSPVGKKLLSDGPIAVRELDKAANIWAAGIQRDLSTQCSKDLEKLLADKGVKPVPAEPPKQ